MLLQVKGWSSELSLLISVSSLLWLSSDIRRNDKYQGARKRREDFMNTAGRALYKREEQKSSNKGYTQCKI